MFTVYLIKVVWGGDAHVCAPIIQMLLGCQKLEKLFYENATVVKYSDQFIFRAILSIFCHRLKLENKRKINVI